MGLKLLSVLAIIGGVAIALFTQASVEGIVLALLGAIYLVPVELIGRRGLGGLVVGTQMTLPLGPPEFGKGRAERLAEPENVIGASSQFDKRQLSLFRVESS